MEGDRDFGPTEEESLDGSLAPEPARGRLRPAARAIARRRLGPGAEGARPRTAGDLRQGEARTAAPSEPPPRPSRSSVGRQSILPCHQDQPDALAAGALLDRHGRLHAGAADRAPPRAGDPPRLRQPVPRAARRAASSTATGRPSFAGRTRARRPGSSATSSATGASPPPRSARRSTTTPPARSSTSAGTSGSSTARPRSPRCSACSARSSA